MRRVFLTVAALMVVPAIAAAVLVEVPPDDYEIWLNSGGDVVQTATAPHPNEDKVLGVWTNSLGNGPRQILAGVIDANVPTGEALVQVDVTDSLVRDPAVAWDAGTGKWLICWSQMNAPGEYEVYGRLMDVAGNLNPAPIRISFTGVTDSDPAFDALQPAVASNEHGKFLVAWAADDDAVGLPDGGFEIFRRTVNANGESLGSVVQQSNFSPLGGAALQPELGYFYSNDSWVMLWEADGTSDPTLYQPDIYGALIPVAGIPREASQPVLISGGAARRSYDGAQNPTLAVDRLHQQVAFMWDRRSAADPVARVIDGAIFDADFVGVQGFLARDLGAEGYAPNAYVRDSKVTHSRISGTYVMTWRESFSPVDGTGQTIMAREYDEATGFTDLAIPIVNQGVPGPLPTEFGPPVVEGGWRNNGRVFTGFVADKDVKGEFAFYGQGLDTQAATAAPPNVIPLEFALGLAPNPFNPRTSIELSLPVAGRARVDIYDVRGRLVRKLVDEDLPAGTYSRTWSGLDDHGRSVASGVYMVKLHHPGGERVVKATLVE